MREEEKEEEEVVEAVRQWCRGLGVHVQHHAVRNKTRLINKTCDR